MFFGHGWDGQELKNTMKDDFGFVFFPKGPKASDYIVPVQQECKIYVMPNMQSTQEKWLKFLKNISFYNDNVGFESWINTFLDTDGEKNTARMMLEKGRYRCIKRILPLIIFFSIK